MWRTLLPYRGQFHNARADPNKNNLRIWICGRNLPPGFCCAGKGRGGEEYLVKSQTDCRSWPRCLVKIRNLFTIFLCDTVFAAVLRSYVHRWEIPILGNAPLCTYEGGGHLPNHGILHVGPLLPSSSFVSLPRETFCKWSFNRRKGKVAQSSLHMWVVTHLHVLEVRRE